MSGSSGEPAATGSGVVGDARDFAAIARLLDERDKELALAASIGKDLLEKSQHLQARCDSLEMLLVAERDESAQLRHELNMKEELLAIYAMNEDRQRDRLLSSVNSGHDSSLRLQVASLERKLHQLESENAELRRQAVSSRSGGVGGGGGGEAAELEREAVLVKECIRQLAESNLHIKGLSDNLNQRTDLYMSQQTEIGKLLAKNVGLESKVKRVAMERDMQEARLKETHQAQRALTTELSCLHDRYDECLAMLDRSQHEAASLRRKLKAAMKNSAEAAASNGAAMAAAAAAAAHQQHQQHQQRSDNNTPSSAPPPPYELSLMSELERSDGAARIADGSTWNEKPAKVAIETTSNPPAVSRRQPVANRRPNSAYCRSGRTANIGCGMSGRPLRLDSIYAESWRSLFRSVSVGNLTSPTILESQQPQLLPHQPQLAASSTGLEQAYCDSDRVGSHRYDRHRHRRHPWFSSPHQQQELQRSSSGSRHLPRRQHHRHPRRLGVYSEDEDFSDDSSSNTENEPEVDEPTPTPTPTPTPSSTLMSTPTPTIQHHQLHAHHHQQQQRGWLLVNTIRGAAGSPERPRQLLRNSATFDRWRRFAAMPGLRAAVGPRTPLPPGVAVRSGIGAGGGSDIELDDDFCHRATSPPPHRATSLDAINRYSEIADTTARSRGLLTRQQRQHQLDGETAAAASALVEEPERRRSRGEGGARGWLLPTLGASFIRSLLQLSLVVDIVDNESREGDCAVEFSDEGLNMFQPDGDFPPNTTMVVHRLSRAVAKRPVPEDE